MGVQGIAPMDRRSFSEGALRVPPAGNFNYNGGKRRRPRGSIRPGGTRHEVRDLGRAVLDAAWMIPAGLEHFYHIYPQPGANSSHPLAAQMLMALLDTHLFDPRQSGRADRGVAVLFGSSRRCR